MNGLDKRRYEMLVRVREFGRSHAELFPPDTMGGRGFAEVTKAIEKLVAHSAEHFSGRGSAREGVTTKAVARDALREDIEALVRTARAMSLDTPGLEDKFRPHAVQAISPCSIPPTRSPAMRRNLPKSLSTTACRRTFSTI